MTDHEIALYVAPGPALAHVVNLHIWALDDAGSRWRLTWDGAYSDYRGRSSALEGAWGTIRAYVTGRMQDEGLTHLRPVRHRDDDAQSHDAAALAIRLLRDGAAPGQLRPLARYTGPSAHGDRRC